MMNKRRTNKWLQVKYLFLVPLTAFALVACNLDSSSQKPSNEAEEEVISSADTTQVTGDLTKDAFDVVEQMPEFPGGAEEMMKFMMNNVKYPKEAMDKGTEGQVMVMFVVDKDGSVVEPQVVKKVDPLLDEEALRVVKLMPKWKPGMQRGEIVRVKYTIPVSFRLQ